MSEVHVNHCPSSQGWAPECPINSFCVCLYFTGVVCWVQVSFLSSLPLQLPWLHARACSVLHVHDIYTQMKEKLSNTYKSNHKGFIFQRKLAASSVHVHAH